MANPRVFISSTYYDMRSIRANLESFVHEQGYEPVLFERGHVPYGMKESLEGDCYREISTCDILVNIVGGNYGTPSKDTPYSISQNELRKAYDLGLPIYIFVDRPVLAEYKFYQANRAVKDLTYKSVNDVRIFSCLDDLYRLLGQAPIMEFQTSQDIVDFLRKQWAGLFQGLLVDLAHKQEGVRKLFPATRRESEYSPSTSGETKAFLDVSQMAEFRNARSRHIICYAVKNKTYYDTALAVINHGLFSQSGEDKVIPTRLTFYFCPQRPWPTWPTPTIFTYTTNTLSPGTGLDAAGCLAPGGTYTILLSQLLPAVGASPEFTGFIVLTSTSPNVHCLAIVSDHNFNSYVFNPEVVSF